MSVQIGLPTGYSPFPPVSDRASEGTLNRYKRIFGRCAGDLRRYTEGTQKPGHLRKMIVRNVTRGMKALYGAFDDGVFVSVWCLQPEQRPPSGSDAALWDAWRMCGFPWVRAVKPAAFGAGAGDQHFPSPKVNAEGKLLGSDGNLVEVIEGQSDVRAITMADGKEVEVPKSLRLGPVACAHDDFDDADWLAHHRETAQDAIHALDALADLVDEQLAEVATPISRKHEPLSPYPQPSTTGVFGVLTTRWEAYLNTALDASHRIDDDNELDPGEKDRPWLPRGREEASSLMRDAGHAYWDELLRVVPRLDDMRAEIVAGIQESVRIPNDEQLTEQWVLGTFANAGHRLLAVFARAEAARFASKAGTDNADPPTALLLDNHADDVAERVVNRLAETANAQKDPIGKTIKPKRSTVRGEGRDKLIPALSLHHQYANGSRMILEPIGNNKLARLAGVSRGSASAFFKKEFGGYLKYQAVCREPATLIASLKLLNAEFVPQHLYGDKPLGETDSETD